MKKRHLAILCTGFLAIGLLTGCQKEEKAKEQEVKAQETEAAADYAAEAAPVTEEAFEEAPAEEAYADMEAGDGGEDYPDVPLIGVVTYEGGVEDASFNQSAWEGLQRLSGLYDCGIKFLEGGGSAGFEEKLGQMIQEGGDLIWGMGYECRDAVLSAAPENPSVSFAIFDYADEDLPPNVTGVVFRAEEPSFLAGVLAGTMTETGKVGFVGGVKDEIIDQFRYGYEAGVLYAAKESGREVSFEAVYADSYDNPEQGKTLAKELYDGGCDILFHAAGETGTGVIQAAKEAEKYVIGVDKDQSFLAPKNVLTSVMKYVNKALVDVSGDFLDGNGIGGENITLGLSEDALGISENHELYSMELYQELLSLKDEIIAGTIDPPGDEEEYNAFVNG